MKKWKIVALGLQQAAVSWLEQVVDLNPAPDAKRYAEVVLDMLEEAQARVPQLPIDIDPERLKAAIRDASDNSDIDYRNVALLVRVARLFVPEPNGYTLQGNDWSSHRHTLEEILKAAEGPIERGETVTLKRGIFPRLEPASKTPTGNAQLLVQQRKPRPTGKWRVDRWYHNTQAPIEYLAMTFGEVLDHVQYGLEDGDTLISVKKEQA